MDQHGLSYAAITAEVGVHRVTVSAWLKEAAAATPALPASPEEPAPPPPWESWDTVRHAREALQQHRYLLIRRPAHRSADQQIPVDALLSSPAGPELQVARRLVTEWYLRWHDEEGQRRTLEEARTRFAAWSTDAGFAAVAPLQRVQTKMIAQFERVSACLRQQEWEATNNGRAFRTGISASAGTPLQSPRYQVD